MTQAKTLRPDLDREVHCRKAIAAIVGVITSIVAGCEGGHSPGLGTVSLAASSYSVARDAQLLMIEVVRTGDARGAASVAYATTGGGAIADTHFIARSGTLNWISGEAASKFIAIPIRDDGGASGEGDFAVTLSQPVGVGLETGHATVHVGMPLGPAVRVKRNRLVDASGNILQLRGANVGSLGGMYALSNRSPEDPWMGNKPDWRAMKAWRINAVRITLNEASLLGLTTYDPIDNTAWHGDSPRAIGMPRSADPGQNYRQSLIDAVKEATAEGMMVILDLHMNAPDDKLPGFAGKVAISPGVASYMQQPMADRDHALAFWTWLATAFKSYPNVIFDLFNEPYFFSFSPGRWDTESNWRQLRNGTTVPFYNTGGNGAVNTDSNGDPYLRSRSPSMIYHSWQAVGMQEMLNTVRAAGATNVVMIGGVGYAGEMSLWLKYRPADPLKQIVAAWHAYQDPKDDSKPAWGKRQFKYVATIAEQYPVVIGELGGNDANGSKGSRWASTVLPWADQHGISYLGWSWDPWNSADNELIKDKSGTPTGGYGRYFKDHLLCVADGQNNCP
jgi:hypothetical protein